MNKTIPAIALSLFLTPAVYAINLEPLIRPEAPLGFESKDAPFANAVFYKAKSVEDELIQSLCPTDGSMDCKKLGQIVRNYTLTYCGEDWRLIDNSLRRRSRTSAKKLEYCFFQVTEKFKGYEDKAIAEKAVSFCSKEIPEHARNIARRRGFSVAISELAAQQITDAEIIEAFEAELRLRALFPDAVKTYRIGLGVFE